MVYLEVIRMHNAYEDLIKRSRH